MITMTRPAFAIGDRVRIRQSARPLRGQYVQAGGERLIRDALPGPYRVVDVAGDQVTLIYDLVPEIFETTADALAEALSDREGASDGHP